MDKDSRLGQCDKDFVEWPGQWHSIHNTTTSESFTKAFDSQTRLGIKYNLPNCLEKHVRPKKSKVKAPLHGAYDMYKLCFNLWSL